MILSLSFVDFLLNVKEFWIIFTWVDFCNKSFIPNCLSLSFFSSLSLFFFFFGLSAMFIFEFFHSSKHCFFRLDYLLHCIFHYDCPAMLTLVYWFVFLRTLLCFFVSGMLFTATNRFPCFSWSWIFLQLFAFFIN
jgi:hypothetical protein